jgi:hypothetical protein
LKQEKNIQKRDKKEQLQSKFNKETAMAPLNEVMKMNPYQKY